MQITWCISNGKEIFLMNVILRSMTSSSLQWRGIREWGTDLSFAFWMSSAFVSRLLRKISMNLLIAVPFSSPTSGIFTICKLQWWKIRKFFMCQLWSQCVYTEGLQCICMQTHVTLLLQHTHTHCVALHIAIGYYTRTWLIWQIRSWFHRLVSRNCYHCGHTDLESFQTLCMFLTV